MDNDSTIKLIETQVHDLEKRLTEMEHTVIPQVYPNNKSNNNAEQTVDTNTQTAENLILKARLDSVTEENSLLKKDIDKLNYRIKHLIRSLNNEENTNTLKNK